MIKPGDIYKIAGTEFKIVKVGSEVQKNLMNLGHITIKKMFSHRESYKMRT